MTRQEKLEIFKEKGYTYNHLTGEIRNSRSKISNYKNKDGYIMCPTTYVGTYILIAGHILAWYLYYGEVLDYPEFEIDHLDGDTSNNKIDNLAKKTHQGNMWNQHGVKGYTWDKQHNKWQAQIHLNDKQIHLGRFDNELDARQAYLDAKKIHHTV